MNRYMIGGYDPENKRVATSSVVIQESEHGYWVKWEDVEDLIQEHKDEMERIKQKFDDYFARTL